MLEHGNRRYYFSVSADVSVHYYSCSDQTWCYA